MQKDDLLKILKAESDSAIQYNDGRLSAERNKAIRDYMRGEYGNEEEGRSSVVSSEVFDTIEGMIPEILDIFTGSSEPVVFDPVGPEDEDGAKQATVAANHVFYKQNNGFLILYTAIKDALLMKTGGVKWWWDNSRLTTFTSYQGLTDEQMAMVAGDDNVSVIEHEQVMKDMETPMGVIQVPVHNIKIKAISEKKQVKVVNVPPEELLISSGHNSILLDDCPYVAHYSEKTVSEIRSMGYKVDVSDVKAASKDGDYSNDDRYIDTVNGYDDDEALELDESQVKGWIHEEYILVDYDGDGIAERRRVIRLGDLILDNDEVSHVQIAAWTPYILTHRFHGVSVAELVSEFQRAQTEIWRQSLDNLYLANNQETVVLTDSQGNPQANIDDLLNRRPGGIMRESTPGAIRPYMQSWVGVQAGPMVELMRGALENRTGWTRYSQGTDGQSLNKTATGVTMIMNASKRRQRMMARIMAEGLLVPLFKGIYKTLMDNCLEQMSVRLLNKFVPVDPQSWRDGYDLTINVGIGTGEKDQQLSHLMQIANFQSQAVGAGGMGLLVTPQNIFNLQKRIVENAGFVNPEEFWTNPQNQMPQPKKPESNPDIEKEQMRIQADAQKFQAESQIEQQKMQQESELRMMEMRSEQETALAKAKLEQETRIAIELERLSSKERELLMTSIARSNNGTELPEADHTAEIVIALQQQIAMLQSQMNAPKRVIRDGNGRVAGIETVQ